MDIVYSAQTNVADYERAYLMAQAAFQKEVNAAVSNCVSQLLGCRGEDKNNIIIQPTIWSSSRKVTLFEYLQF